MFQPAIVDDDGNYTFKMYPEEWRWIPEWEGYYAISNYGQVYSVPRQIIRTHQDGRKDSYLLNGRMLKPGLDGFGYECITLQGNGRTYPVRVHILVAAAFIGPCPPGHIVCHNNGIPSDNVVWNLRYATHQENTTDMIKHGTRGYGERNAFAKYTEDQIREVKHLLQDHSVNQISNLTGVGSRSIENVKYGITWNHI